MLVVVGALREAVLRPLQPSSESSEAALLAEVMVMEFVDVCEGVAGGVVLLVAAGNPLAGVDMQLYLAVVEAEGMGENPKVGEIINLSLFVKEEVGVDVLRDPMARCHHFLYPLSVCLSVCVSVCVSVSNCLYVCWLQDGAELLEKYRVLRSGHGRGVLVCAPDSMMLCDCGFYVVTCK